MAMGETWKLSQMKRTGKELRDTGRNGVQGIVDMESFNGKEEGYAENEKLSGLE